MVPLFTAKGVIGTLAVGSKSENAFARRDIDLKKVAAGVSLANPKDNVEEGSR
jgi:hypothetical protein